MADKNKILAEIAEYNSLIADSSVPQDEKDFAKEEIADLQKQLDKLTGAPAGKVHVVKTGATAKAGPKLTELTTKEEKAYKKNLDYARNMQSADGMSSADVFKLAWENTQDQFPRLKNFDGVKPEKGKKAKKPASAKIKANKKTVSVYKGKRVTDLNEKECQELLKEIQERRAKAKKSEKKSKSKPIVEKIGKNVATAVKQVIENVAASDIKDDPNGQIKKMKAIEKAAKEFLAKMKSILGADYDKESIDGEFKEVHQLIKELEKKYK